MRPKILVDTRETNLGILNALLREPEGIEISMKVGGSGDYIIVDKNGDQWGIERKEFTELYQAILPQKDVYPREGRIYGQLAELKRDYGKRSILMVHEFKGIKWHTTNPAHMADKVKRAVYTFFSERSFAFITMMVKNEEHAAHVLKKLAKALPDVEFEGRGYRVVRI